MSKRQLPPLARKPVYMSKKARQCGKKRMTQEEAQALANKVMNAYDCPWCPHWHIGRGSA